MQSMHNVHIISTLHSKDLHKEEKVYVASCTWLPLSCYHKSRDTLFLQTSVLKKSSKLCCLMSIPPHLLSATVYRLLSFFSWHCLFPDLCKEMSISSNTLYTWSSFINGLLWHCFFTDLSLEEKEHHLVINDLLWRCPFTDLCLEEREHVIYYRTNWSPLS